MFIWGGAGVLATGLTLDQLRVLLSFGRFHTDQDETILWYAGRELLSGKVYEPNFFGQRYNTTFEAVPGALVHAAGLSWGTALPLTTTLLVSLAWVLLAATAYRRGLNRPGIPGDSIPWKRGWSHGREAHNKEVPA
jgi:hypothetical protein